MDNILKVAGNVQKYYIMTSTYIRDNRMVRKKVAGWRRFCWAVLLGLTLLVFLGACQSGPAVGIADTGIEALTVCPCDSVPDTLTVDQVEAVMVGTFVRVEGAILWITDNPGGLGGAYVHLGDGQHEVGVRIKDPVWQELRKSVKNHWAEGSVIRVEGRLVQAGKYLVVVLEDPIKLTE